jgi:hypothetical protein
MRGRCGRKAVRCCNGRGRPTASAFIDAVGKLGLMPADRLEELARVNVPALVPSV